MADEEKQVPGYGDPADQNLDGTVSPAERNSYERKQQRAAAAKIREQRRTYDERQTDALQERMRQAREDDVKARAGTSKETPAEFNKRKEYERSVKNGEVPGKTWDPETEEIVDTDSLPPPTEPRYFGRRGFSEQCYLLGRIIDLSAYKASGATPTELGGTKKLPYVRGAGNASLLVDGNAYGFINALTQHPAQGAFFDMKTKEISSLQPMIRLYKVIEGDNPSKSRQQEFMFDSHASKTDVESLFSNTAKRGFGVGIQDFSFSYEGTTPFAAKKSIKATLKIFASSFEELLTMRPDGYRYIELALKTGKMNISSDKLEEQARQQCRNVEDLQENLNDHDFRLKAVVGWARPPRKNNIAKTEAEKRTVSGAINESYTTLNLTPTTHEFNLDEKGAVVFTINYLAYIDDLFSQAEFDIFYDEEVTANQLARDAINAVLDEVGEPCGDEKKSKFKQYLMDENAIEKNKMLNMQSLMQRMGATTDPKDPKAPSKIKYISVSEVEGTTVTDLWEKTGNPSVKSAMSDVTDDEKAVQKKITDWFMDHSIKASESRVTTAAETNLTSTAYYEISAGSTSDRIISFFYVSDLVDVILEGIESRLKHVQSGATWGDVGVTMKGYLGDLREGDPGAGEGSPYKLYKEKQIRRFKRFHADYRKFRLVLGPLELVHPTGGESKSVNFGDIPVSVKYFMGWMNNRLIERGVTQWGLTQFLREFFNHITRDFLNNKTCFTGGPSIKQKTALNSTVITSYKSSTSKFDEFTDWIENSGGTRANVLNMNKPVLNISGPRGRNDTSPIIDGGINNEINYFIFSAARSQPKELQRGRRAEDEERGIFHYSIGRDRGITKTINLTRHDSKYLKVVRFQESGYDGLKQLREVYNTQIECFANVKAFPGTYIFVDPRGWAPNTLSYEGGDTDLTQYGIGGYCMIIKSEHKFGPGRADSKILAHWVAGIDPLNEKCTPPQQSSAGDGGTKKNCKGQIFTDAHVDYGKKYEDREVDTVGAPPTSLSPW